MPPRRKPRRQESALYLHLLVNSDIHLPVFPRSSVLLICTGGQLSQHRDYGGITGGQNALSPFNNSYFRVAQLGMDVGASENIDQGIKAARNPTPGLQF
jgi:hypothetical protein